MTLVAYAILVCWSLVSAIDQPTAVIVRVNDSPITAADLEFAATQMAVPAESRKDMDPILVEQLIDRQLIRGFLASRKIEPVAEDLQQQIARAEELIRKRGEDPDKLLGKLGYTPQRLKSELGLPLAWMKYARKNVTPEQIKLEFEQHKPEFDGTLLRARQIFLKTMKPQTEADVVARKAKLGEIRAEIVAGRTSFADAAKSHSEAPTREQGGDVGLFGWQGKLPPSVSHAAFALKIDEISQPIVSPFGVHLIQLTERHPGDLSLEDVRPVIFERLSQQLWTATVASERAKAKIEKPQ